jgi:uncharacterized membrane protein
MILSVLPIIGGVLLSSSVEISFHIFGCLMALFSCFTYCYQNIYAKILVDSKRIDQFNLLIYANLGASIVLFMLAFATEWTSLADYTGAHLVTLNSKSIQLILGIGIFHFLQSISAVSFLGWVSSVSYSIANTFKRVFVIILSIIYFGNTVSLLNYIGIIISVIGILSYSKANELHRARIAKIVEREPVDSYV